MSDDYCYTELFRALENIKENPPEGGPLYVFHPRELRMFRDAGLFPNGKE